MVAEPISRKIINLPVQLVFSLLVSILLFQLATLNQPLLGAVIHATIDLSSIDPTADPSIALRAELEGGDRSPVLNDWSVSSRDSSDPLYKPDLYFSVFPTLSADVVSSGTMVYVNATVSNKGNDTASDIQYEMFDGNPFGGGTPLDSHTITSLSPSSSVNLDRTVNITDTGSHDLYCIIDRGDTISEWSEDNNMASAALHVNIPPEAALVSPGKGESRPEGEIELEWNGTDEDQEATGGVLTHVLYVSKNLNDVSSHSASARVYSGIAESRNVTLGQGIWYWCVEANDGWDRAFSQVWYVEVCSNHQPSARLQMPVNGTEIKGLEVCFQWMGEDPDSQDEGNLTYTLYSDTSEDKVLALDTDSMIAVTGNTSHCVSGLERGMDYFWTVIPKDPYVNGTCDSGIWWFHLSQEVEENTAPTVQLYQPADNSVLSTKTPKLMWTGSDGDGDYLNYSVYISQNITKVEELDPDALVTVTSASDFATSEVVLQDNRTYYWTVVPSDGEAPGTCISGVWCFSISLGQDNNPPVVELRGPENGTIVAEEEVVLTWAGYDYDGDPLEYRVTIYMEEYGGTQYITEDGIETEEYLFANIVDKTDYYWLVEGDDGRGWERCRQDHWHFRTDFGVENHPPRTELVSPAEGALLKKDKVTFTWSGQDEDASDIEAGLEYTIYLSTSEEEVTALDLSCILADNVTSTKYTAVNLATGLKYYWTVIPHDPQGPGYCISGIHSFSIFVPSPPLDGIVIFFEDVNGRKVNISSTDKEQLQDKEYFLVIRSLLDRNVTLQLTSRCVLFYYSFESSAPITLEPGESTQVGVKMKTLEIEDNNITLDLSYHYTENPSINVSGKKVIPMAVKETGGGGPGNKAFNWLPVIAAVVLVAAAALFTVYFMYRKKERAIQTEIFGEEETTPRLRPEARKVPKTPVRQPLSHGRGDMELIEPEVVYMPEKKKEGELGRDESRELPRWKKER